MTYMRPAGVHAFEKNTKFKAVIGRIPDPSAKDGKIKRFFLGKFDTAEEAARFRDKYVSKRDGVPKRGMTEFLVSVYRHGSRFYEHFHRNFNEDGTLNETRWSCKEEYVAHSN